MFVGDDDRRAKGHPPMAEAPNVVLYSTRT